MKMKTIVGILILMLFGTISSLSQSNDKSISTINSPVEENGVDEAIEGLPLTGAATKMKTVKVSYSALEGLERDPNGFLRRDNSDIIKVGSFYYVWYSKMRQFVPDLPVVSTVWYATSPDGQTWTEKGECITIGAEGAWDDLYVYTPGILVAKGKYYLFYTAISTAKSDNGLSQPNTAMGIAVSDSPDGPWTKLPSNPILVPSTDTTQFDSHRVDDACVLIRNGRYWLYYKGRQWGKRPTETKMGLAIADNPEGPYIKHRNNPVVGGNHEVLVWPQGEGVAAMIGSVGPSEITHSLMYAKDGVHFEKTHELADKNSPWAPGAYRPEAFTDSGKGQMIQWGLHIGGKRPDLFLERFDIVEERSKK